MKPNRHQQAVVAVVVAAALWSWLGDPPDVVRWAWPVAALAYVVVSVVVDRRAARDDA